MAGRAACRSAPIGMGQVTEPHARSMIKQPVLSEHTVQIRFRCAWHTAHPPPGRARRGRGFDTERFTSPRAALSAWSQWKVSSSLDGCSGRAITWVAASLRRLSPRPRYLRKDSKPSICSTQTDGFTFDRALVGVSHGTKVKRAKLGDFMVCGRQAGTDLFCQLQDVFAESNQALLTA